MRRFKITCRPEEPALAARGSAGDVVCAAAEQARTRLFRTGMGTGRPPFARTVNGCYRAGLGGA